MITWFGIAVRTISSVLLARSDSQERTRGPGCCVLESSVYLLPAVEIGSGLLLSSRVQEANMPRNFAAIDLLGVEMNSAVARGRNGGENAEHVVALTEKALQMDKPSCRSVATVTLRPGSYLATTVDVLMMMMIFPGLKRWVNCRFQRSTPLAVSYN